MEVDMSAANEAMQKHAKETALDSGGWVENRFRLLEERLARIESGKPSWTGEDEDDYSAALEAPHMTVGEFRTRLASANPATALIFEVDGSDDKWVGEVWAGQSLTDDSHPTKVVYDRRSIVRLRKKACRGR